MDQLPSREDVSNLDTLSPISQEGADPADDDVRQPKLHHLGHQYVVINVVEGFGVVNKNGSN
jgi:hypothetical protein